MAIRGNATPGPILNVVTHMRLRRRCRYCQYDCGIHRGYSWSMMAVADNVVPLRNEFLGSELTLLYGTLTCTVIVSPRDAVLTLPAAPLTLMVVVAFEILGRHCDTACSHRSSWHRSPFRPCLAARAAFSEHLADHHRPAEFHDPQHDHHQNRRNQGNFDDDMPDCASELRLTKHPSIRTDGGLPHLD